MTTRPRRRASLTVTAAVAAALGALAASPHALPALSFARQGTVPAWTFRPDLRIGGGVDGPTNFTEIRGIATTRSGNIFVLEFKEQELRVFDARGGFVRRAARRGAGPGELSNANGIAVGADDVVWANDPANSRFSLYHADGTFIRQVLTPIGGFSYLWRGKVLAPDRIIDDLPLAIPTSKIDPATHRPVFDYRLRFVTGAGKADTVDYPHCPGRPSSTSSTLIYGLPGKGGQAYISLPFQPRPQVAFTRQGTAWCTPSDEYRVLVGPVGGALSEVVRRDFPPVVVTDAERQREQLRLDSARVKFGALQSGDPSAMPRVKPAIASIVADDQGRVWVRRNGVPVNAPIFEVYDGSGKQVATVTVQGPVGEQVVITGDTLLTINNDVDDVPFVVRYRIAKR